MILTPYLEDARRAHLGTSFFPEERAAQMITGYSEELSSDLRELAGSSGNYEAKYIAKWQKWMSSKSRCMSSMITGPANFPVAKNRKNNGYEHNAYEDFRKWRERYFKAVNRVPTPSPEEEIDDALKKLDIAIEAHEIMKLVNKIVKKKTISDDEKLRLLLVDELLSESTARKIIEPDDCGRVGFAGFTLTNSNARIKGLKSKLLIMRNRIAIRDTFKPIEFDGGKITIEDDRVCIYHDEKPGKEVIQKLKENGFRWSPHYVRWQRKHTQNGLRAAKYVMGVKQWR